jgi:hypothetical protein
MKTDFQRELIPRDDTLRLIGTLNTMVAKFSDTAQQWQLLDESGHVQAEPSYAELLQHATGAHDLARDVLRLTADFAASPHSTNRAGRATLAHLATASTMSAQATAHFAETAEAALRLPRPSSATDPYYLKNRMLIDHATARAYLRRTSESLRDAAKELDDHLDLHRFLITPAHRDSPMPPPPKPSGQTRALPCAHHVDGRRMSPSACSKRRIPCPHVPSSPAPTTASATAASTSSWTECPATTCLCSWPPTGTSSGAIRRPCAVTSSTTSPSVGRSWAPISSAMPRPCS